MKNYFSFIALAALALASCTSDEFVGENKTETLKNEGQILFTTGTSSITRADHVGADAANLLNNRFVVGGFKGTESPATTIVFDNYLVNWTANTASTTESNTNDWEYVGITAEDPSGISGNTQTIKYWDYSTSQYDYVAYSKGTATNVTASAIDAANLTTAAYTLEGSAEDLAKCYIADLVTHYKEDKDPAQPKYQDVVKLTFRSLGTKVRMAIYETVPGYSVKAVKFYTDATTELSAGASETNATLFSTGTAPTDLFFTDGKMTVNFPTIGSSNLEKTDYNKAHVSFAAADGATGATTKDFGELNYGTKESNEKSNGDIWLGRTLPTASYAGTADPYYLTVLPNETGTVLELRVDYTLESIDGSGEEITVHGATAFVPVIYTQWKPNYAYTYVFKISDNTNGWTSTAGTEIGTDPAGLYPITFDAIVTDAVDGTQATITTVATPSITTYQKGHDVTKDEYSASADEPNIYVQVMSESTLKDDLGTNGQLYTVAKTGTAEISEATVMDALNIIETTASDVTTGRNGIQLTKATSDATITAVPGADGNDITVDAGTAAKFKPAAGTYAYVYKVADGTAGELYTNITVTAGEDVTDYYVMNADGTYTAATGTAVEGTYYYKKYTVNNTTYAVKVIKVVE